MGFITYLRKTLQSMETRQLLFNLTNLNAFDIQKEDSKHSRVYRRKKYLKSVAKKVKNEQLAFELNTAIDLDVNNETLDLGLELNLDFNIEEEEKKFYNSNLNLKSETELDIKEENKEVKLKTKNIVKKQKSNRLSLVEEPGNDNSLLAYINDMRNNENVKGLLTAKEEIEFFKRIEQGDENAKKEFANHNLRLVVSVAKKFFTYGNFFSEGDIIQEGNIGLMTAISKFDYRKGVKFSTYAVFWIEQSIRRAYEDRGQAIRLPNYRQTQLNKINKFKKQYLQEHNREPSIAEIAQETKMKEFSVEKALSYSSVTISLNVSGDEEDGNEMIDSLSDNFNLEDHIVNKVINKENIMAVQKGLKLLDEVEKEIILLKYYENYKLSEIEKKLNLTTKEIKKKLNSSFKKIKGALIV